jgi:hypothetical protein
LAAAGLAYCAVLVLTYSAATPTASLTPDFRALERVFFGQQKPVGLLERLLESTEGPLNRAGTMRPAFTDQSLNWEALIQNKTAEERAALLAEREGERLALLAWVQTGFSQVAYDADDFPLPAALAAHPLTAKYRITPLTSPDQDAVARVRIRSILADRCVTCHSENGRHDQARWIPLDTYKDLEFKFQPEAASAPQTTWLIVALAALLPLALLSGPLFYFTSTPFPTRLFLAVLPLAALLVVAGVWLLGQPQTYSIHLFLGAAALAALGVLIQIVAVGGELFGKPEPTPLT